MLEMSLLWPIAIVTLTGCKAIMMIDGSIIQVKKLDQISNYRTVIIKVYRSNPVF